MTALARSPFSLYLNACLPEAAPAEPTARRIQIHKLLTCPALPQGTRYKLVQCIKGQRSTLAIGRATSRYATINLATLRRRGARLGVHEVHVLV